MVSERPGRRKFETGGGSRGEYRWMILLLVLGLLQIEPRDRCVLLSADVQKAPPRIELRWTADPKATGYSVFRKAPTDAGWVETGMPLEATETHYVDTSVQVGVAYEYKVL